MMAFPTNVTQSIQMDADTIPVRTHLPGI